MSKTPIFTGVQHTKLRTNQFDLSYDNKLSTQMGRLTPFLCMETVPGDKISIKPSVFAKFAPMIAPVMHKVNIFMHCFYVPNRILWDGWEDFITGGEDGYDNTVWPFMTVDLETVERSSLADYLSIPTKDDLGATGDKIVDLSALPFNAYQKIYDDYYRDQNLQTEVWTPLVDGINPVFDNLPLRNRAWMHDYYTSALPWTQKGPEALLPLSGNAPVRAYDRSDPNAPLDWTQNYLQSISGAGAINDEVESDASAQIANSANQLRYIDINDTNFADLSEASQTSIIDLRRAFKLQEWLEKNARGGSRYIESIKVHFGVNSSDKRLQRPEYLGGFKTPVKISEVLNTTGAVDDAGGGSDITFLPQGNMSGHGVAAGSGDYVSHFSEEHGLIIGIMSIMPNTSYQQGIPKHFLKPDKFDYFWPEFQHIGEQPIEMQELFVGGSRLNTDTFGYTPRYAEYKQIPNSVHGDFKDSLDFWHLGRKFDDSPILNEEFIRMDEKDVDRIFAIQNYDENGDPLPENYDNIWIHIINTIKAKRPMAVYGTPKF